jgi:hypothetical protein
MKIAVLSESPADEAAIYVLIAGLLGRQTQPIEPSRQLRTGGWPAVLQVIPTELKRLHYYLTDTYAFAVVVDADNSPLHQSAHEVPGGEVAKCRLCQLRQVVAKTQNQLRNNVPPESSERRRSSHQESLEAFCLRHGASLIDTRDAASR